MHSTLHTDSATQFFFCINVQKCSQLRLRNSATLRFSAMQAKNGPHCTTVQCVLNQSHCTTVRCRPKMDRKWFSSQCALRRTKLQKRDVKLQKRGTLRRHTGRKWSISLVENLPTHSSHLFKQYWQLGMGLEVKLKLSIFTPVPPIVEYLYVNIQG